MSKETQVKKTENKAKKAPAPAPAKAKAKTFAPKEGWFAVVASGGKQYKISSGDSLKIEKMQGDFKEGDSIVFDKVLLFDDGKGTTTFGTPFIEGSKVEAVLSKIGRAKKVIAIKYKQKSRYFKKYGHRQPYFEVKISGIK